MKHTGARRLIDFTLEVTNGCRYNCTGCFVDKDSNSWPSNQQFDAIDALVADLAGNHFRPMNLQIGPTDIMTSINRDAVLGSERIKTLASKFLKTSINCAFLDPFKENYITLGKQLNWLLHGGMVKFAIPFEAYHIDNTQYIDRIRKRIDWTLEQMPDVTHTKTYLLINYETSSIYDKEQGTNLTEELILKTYNSPLLNGLTADIILPHTRADLRIRENSEQFLQAALKLREMLTRARKTYGQTIDIAELMAHEGKDWDIFYKAGKLYMTPFLLEGLACFDPAFEVSGDWSLDGLYATHNNNLVNQIIWADKHPVCGGCQFVHECAERGVHTLMQVANINQCISPVKPLETEVMWNS